MPCLSSSSRITTCDEAFLEARHYYSKPSTTVRILVQFTLISNAVDKFSRNFLLMFMQLESSFYQTMIIRKFRSSSSQQKMEYRELPVKRHMFFLNSTCAKLIRAVNIDSQLLCNGHISKHILIQDNMSVGKKQEFHEDYKQKEMSVELQAIIYWAGFVLLWSQNTIYM